MQFPYSVEQITAVWLTTALRNSGAIGEASVESFWATRIDGGVMGEVHRLQLNYLDATSLGPISIIAKTALNDQERRRFADSTGVFEREVRFYGELAPLVHARTPRVFFSQYDERSGYCLLLLEDLGQFRSRPQRAGSTFDDACAVMEFAAGVHADWWGDSRLADYPWLIDYAQSQSSDLLRDQIVESEDRFLRIALEYLPHEFESTFRKLTPRTVELRHHIGNGPTTLTHGDLRLANLFFDDSKVDEDSVIAVDWQWAGRSRSAIDVAIFIGWSFDVGNRRKYGNELLSIYHEGLLSLGVQGFSFDDLLRDYRIGLAVRSTQLSQLVVNLKSGDQELDRRRQKSISERMQALLDWDCEELLK